MDELGWLEYVSHNQANLNLKPHNYSIKLNTNQNPQT